MNYQKIIFALVVGVFMFWLVQYRGASRSKIEKYPTVHQRTKRNVKKYVCNGPDDCLEVHLKSAGLKYALKDRCLIGNWTNLDTRNLTFTHIPKCGGSYLRHLLHKHFKSRFKRFDRNLGPHVPFFLSQKLHPQNIFFIVLREPVSLAVSLYNYINMQKTLPKHMTNDKFWLSSYKRDPVEWSKDAFIRKALRNQIVRFFSWYSQSAKHGAGMGTGDFTNAKMWREYLSLPESYNRVLEPWVPWSVDHDQLLTNYTTVMPSDYRCTKELKVASILLQRYSAVGIVENYPRFFDTLHKRAFLDDNCFRNMMIDSKEKRNPSKDKISAIKMKIVQSNLDGLFYCSRLLWKIAETINEYDSKCYD